ncbi:MAG TPA: type IV pilus twitching motility protein PilT [Solirubrobacteraceae bacterium]|nr:type IV pilus twitching motility protein PilT [Solirubrobacteraceae bacterium]
MFEVQEALRKLIARGGSDLHLKVAAPPLYRINGELSALDGEAALSEEETQAALEAVLPDDFKRREFAEENEADFSFEIKELSRFRVNAYRQRGMISLAFRAIPNAIRTIEDLQLPPVVRELAEEERGIILLTGTTGSGKSTTLAAMIDHINATMAKHIVTIEDPIEYVHMDKRSAINQREVGMDTASFGRAMRRVLRQDPDVILIGEMRDEETVRAALSAAETGHLVLSTVHTLDASESINRILDFFPPHQHNQARSMIAGTLKGVISQRLVRSRDGGRVAVCEILRMTGRVHDMIKDPEQIGKLRDVIFSGSYYGMQTFDQALFKHVKAGRVEFEEAMRIATSPHDFKLLVEADGKRGTTMEDVERAQKEAAATAAPTGQPAHATAVGNGNGNGNGNGSHAASGLVAGAAAAMPQGPPPAGPPVVAPSAAAAPTPAQAPSLAPPTPVLAAAPGRPAAASMPQAPAAAPAPPGSGDSATALPAAAIAVPGASPAAPAAPGSGAAPAASATAQLSPGAAPPLAPSAGAASAAPLAGLSPGAAPTTPPEQALDSAATPPITFGASPALAGAPASDAGAPGGGLTPGAGA